MKIRVLAAIAVLTSTASLAQEFRGTCTGLVTDAQGAAMPNVMITAIEKATGVKSETVSSATGEYTIPFLVPGEHELTAGMAGSRSTVWDKILNAFAVVIEARD